MASLREEAEYFRLALAMALLDKDAAVVWADRTIMALDDPPIEVIEVSLAGNKLPFEMMSLLASVPGPGDLTAVAHQVLGLLRERLEAGDATLEAAVDMLWGYHNWAAVSEDERRRACKFSADLFGAQEGFWGTLDNLREEVMAFLVRHASPPTAAQSIAAAAGWMVLRLRDPGP